MKALLAFLVFLTWRKGTLAQKAISCAASEADEGTGFGQLLSFTDACDSVCAYDSCPVVEGDTCETIALDGTCGSFASCGADGCECDSLGDVANLVDPSDFEADAGAEVTCDSNSITFRFDKCAANAYGLYLEHFYLDGPAASTGSSLQTDSNNTCTGRISFHNNRMVYEFTLLDNLNACDSMMLVDIDDTTYKNAVQGKVEFTSGAITRTRSLHLDFSCEYSNIATGDLDTDLNPLISVVSVAAPDATGDVNLTMRLWSDSAYTTPVTIGSQYAVGQPLFVSLTTNFESTSSALTVTSAHATLTSDPNGDPHYDFITDGCATAHPVKVADILKNGVDSEVRFSFVSFYFLSTAIEDQDIYLHVSTEICLTAEADCPTDCSGGDRRKRSTGRMKEMVSIGPIRFTAGQHVNRDEKVDSGGIESPVGSAAPDLSDFATSTAPADQPVDDTTAVPIPSTLDESAKPDLHPAGVKMAAANFNGPDAVVEIKKGAAWLNYEAPYIPMLIGCSVLLLFLVLCCYIDKSIIKSRLRRLYAPMDKKPMPVSM